MLKNAQQIRDMQRNAVKCREMQKNVEKWREMQRNADMQRYPHDLHDFHDIYDLHDTRNVIFDILEVQTFQTYNTCWVLWALCILVFLYFCICAIQIWNSENGIFDIRAVFCLMMGLLNTFVGEYMKVAMLQIWKSGRCAAESIVDQDKHLG